MTPAITHELTAAELAAWRGFLRVHAAITKQLDAELERELNLPLSSYEVLINLAAAPNQRLRMAELADRTLLSRSGMTRLVDRLERDGLLKRQNCASDARGSFAVLTEAGRALLARARPAHLESVRRSFLQHLEDDDYPRLAALWERVLPGSTD
ncbi:MAG TPA: MarR family transcriptional regulator [Solirubrobacteraceae bacterium]|nr:MarR family transcriptional regulator [Solirubrobacteraceae bacterium]